MEHSYTIKGMTCNGCRAGVERDLKALPEVQDVVVSLEREEAVIRMDAPIAITSLQAGLKPKYTIKEKTEKQVVDSTTEVPLSKWAQLRPLFLIFGYITIASIAMHYKTWNTQEAMLDFMGLFYIVFSFFKFLDLRGFVTSFRMYDPLAHKLKVYGWIYPFIELGLGILFLLRLEIPVALVTTLVILGITTIGVTRSLLYKQEIQCACLGTALKLPMTEATFIENAIMIAMAVFMLFI
ncbi:MauE/DoxX family redox-associated membrane protein [uncultured Dokdonia sp.]|uniref:heavy-metal-associated domain-containing protein n=1 Tax=uncultured Dokdonia sp. TaxID=575653 RepID=UPI00262A146E|nr:MauE/DoxX family redox-associated membrane protein [uncultured Dokdonia sp.]